MQNFGFVFEVKVSDETDDALENIEAAQESLWSPLDARLDKAGGRWLLTAYTEGSSTLDAFSRVVACMTTPVKGLSVLRLDDDLVAASDIASRIGVSRQAVQQFIGHQEFPVPWAIVASTRVWRWAEVNEWLRANRPDRADDEYWPVAQDAVRINALLLSLRDETLASEPSGLAASFMFAPRRLLLGGHTDLADHPWFAAGAPLRDQFRLDRTGEIASATSSRVESVLRRVNAHLSLAQVETRLAEVETRLAEVEKRETSAGVSADA